MLRAKHRFPIFDRLFSINAQIHRVQTFSKRFHYRCFQSSLQCLVKVLEAFKLSRVQVHHRANSGCESRVLRRIRKYHSHRFREKRHPRLFWIKP